MTPKLRRILAIYMDDAISQVDDAILIRFVKDWLRSPKMKSAARKLASRIGILAAQAVQIWEVTYTNPPSIRRHWMMSLAKGINHYIPFFEKVGIYEEVRYLKEILVGIKDCLTKNRPPREMTPTAIEITENTLEDSMRSPIKLYADVERMEALYTELFQDMEEMGWRDQVVKLTNDFHSPLGQLYSSWMRPSGFLDQIGKKMPGMYWRAVGTGENPYGQSRPEFLGEFASQYGSEMSAWNEVCVSLLKTTQALRQCVPWVPFVDGGPLPELMADLSYVCITMQELIGEFPAGSTLQSTISGNISDADTILKQLHQQDGRKPQGAQQAMTANRAFDELKTALAGLDRRSLYYGAFLEKLLERAEEHLQSKTLAQFQQFIKSAVDPKETVDILEGIEDRTESVLRQNPMSLH